jgi:hypothetical protein
LGRFQFVCGFKGDFILRVHITLVAIHSPKIVFCDF